ncbi:vacuolar protein sorting-associated protein 26-domain-containing protein [Lactarius sanguifluus]|nr:vacuolar protein sorting-associated protein 26-domain-containing protein [Lactarius sanguifluus]
MEVGIEDCLHIKFEYNKSKYHLKDVIVRKIYFLLVRIIIKNMELSIIRHETTAHQCEVSLSLPSSTFCGMDKKFSTHYYFNLVLIAKEDQRFFN